MSPGRTKRAYTSTLRAARAAETRQRILAAARSLFARHGYAATTIEAIAAEAAVAVPTVYQSFGSKMGLLRAELDALDDLGGLAELRAVLEAPDATAPEMTRALARFVRRLLEGAGDVLDAARAAGRADPDLQRLLTGGLQRHNQGVARMTARWARMGVLRAGLTGPQAAAIVASISGHDVYHRLLHDWGWSPRQYERWLADAVERLVLA